MNELLSTISPHMPKPTYFKTLLLHHETLMQHVNVHGKINTAKVLGMSPQAFSTFFPCLIAHIEIVHELTDGE